MPSVKGFRGCLPPRGTPTASARERPCRSPSRERHEPGRKSGHDECEREHDEPEHGDVLEELLVEHKKGIEFFEQNSYKEKDLTLEEFTALYLSTHTETIKNVMKMKLWPFKAAWWMFTFRGRMYRKSIQEQVQSGMAKLE